MKKKKRKERKKMAKIIRLTKEHLDSCYEQLSESAGKRLTDGTVEFKRVFEVKGRKAVVRFTPRAWVKMTLLLDQFDKEVGWYGVASRLGDEEDDEYLISDIIVYPQEVTSATVDMAEPEEMTKWRMEHIEDERYDHMYAHGHSHVRMGTTPSGVDLGHQKEILNQMAEDGFYIFMIYNKRLERTIRIYDMKKNIQFENADISVGFWDDGEDIMGFLADAKKIVKDYVYVTPTYKGQRSGSTEQTPATTKPAVPAAPATPAKPAVPASQKNASPYPVQGMGWRGSQYPRGRFYNYDDDNDEVWDPELGYVPGYVYRQQLDAGYYDGDK